MAISTLVRLMAQFQIIQCAWDRCWLKWDLGNIGKLIHDIKLIYADFPASTIQCCWGQVRKMWKFYQNFLAANPFLPLVYEPGLSLSDQIYAPPCLRSKAYLFLSIYLSLFLSLSQHQIVYGRNVQFYTSCISRMREIFHSVWHKIRSKVTSLSACSWWLILRRISFHQPERSIIWLIYYYGSSYGSFLKRPFCMTCSLHQGMHFTWLLQFDTYLEYKIL